MIAILKLGPFPDLLAKRQPDTLDELTCCAIGYINMEEVATAQIQVPVKTEKGKTPTQNPQLKREKMASRVDRTRRDGFIPLRGRIL